MAILDCFFRSCAFFFESYFHQPKAHGVVCAPCTVQCGTWKVHHHGDQELCWRHRENTQSGGKVCMSAEWPSYLGKDIARWFLKSEPPAKEDPSAPRGTPNSLYFLQCWGRCGTWVPKPASTAFPGDLKRRGKRKVISFPRRFCKGHSSVSFLPPLKVCIDVGGNLQYIFLRQGLIIKSWLTWNSLCGPGWPQTHGATCLGLPSAGIKCVCPVKLAGLFPRCAVG